MCLFSIILLWLTNLQFCVRIAQKYIFAPSFPTVSATCQSSYAYVDREREAYRSCAADQVGTCQSQLDESFVKERKRMNKVIYEKDRYLSVLEGKSRRCSDTWTNLKSAISLFSSQGSSYYLSYNSSSCSSSERSKTATLLGDDSKRMYSIMNTLVEYSYKSDETVSNLATYSNEVNDYNTQYLNNKTRYLQSLSRDVVSSIKNPAELLLNSSVDIIDTAMNEFVSCIRANNTISSTCKLDGLVRANEAYETLQKQLKVQIGQADTIMASFKGDMDAFKNDVVNTLSKADEFYNSIVGATGIITWITETYDLFSVSSQLCGRTVPDWCNLKGDFPLSNKISILYPPTLPGFHELPNPSVIWSEIAKSIKEVNDRVNDGSRKSFENGRNVFTSIDSAIESDTNFLPNDYDPPKYAFAENVSVEAVQHRQESIEYRANISGTFPSEFLEPKLTESYKDYVTESMSTISHSLLSEFKGGWASFNPHQVNLDSWLDAFSTVHWYFYMMDFVYRAVQTLRIIRKYSGLSAGEMPSIDLTVNRDKKDKSTISKVIIQYIDYIGIQLLVFMVFSILIIYTISSVYIHTYNSYTSSCVKGSTNSTFLTRNMNSIAFNFANMDGYGDITNGISSYNKQSAELCNSNNRKIAVEAQVFDSSKTMINETFHTSAMNVAKVKKCLNTKEIDDFYLAGCCNTTMYQSEIQCQINTKKVNQSCPNSISNEYYMPPSNYIDNPSCSFDTWNSMHRHYANVSGNLGMDGFNCMALPICTISCDGPDKKIISTVSQACSCTSEWLLHAHIFRMMFACLIYICFNASRIMICRGILMTCWNLVNTPLFECTISCKEDGTLVSSEAQVWSLNNGELTPESIEEESTDSIDSIKEQVRQAITHHVHIGFVYILAGIAIHAIWASYLPFIDNNIAYRPHEQSVVY